MTISDEVLREIVVSAHGYDPRAELARALLEARGALREVRGYVEDYACGKPHPTLDMIDACLPESAPKAEGPHA